LYFTSSFLKLSIPCIIIGTWFQTYYFVLPEDGALVPNMSEGYTCWIFVFLLL